MKLAMKYLFQIVNDEAMKIFVSKLHMAEKYFDNFDKFKIDLKKECVEHVDVKYILMVLNCAVWLYFF